MKAKSFDGMVIPVVPAERSPWLSKLKAENDQRQESLDVVMKILNDLIAKEISIDSVKIMAELGAAKSETLEKSAEELIADDESFFRKLYDEMFPAIVAELNKKGLPFSYVDTDAYSEGLVITPERIRDTFHFLLNKGTFSLRSVGESEE